VTELEWSIDFARTNVQLSYGALFRHDFLDGARRPNKQKYSRLPLAILHPQPQ